MPAMASDDLLKRLAEILDGDGGEPLLGATRFLPLLTLDSGARCGLDREAGWVLVPDDGREPVRYAAGHAYLFHEALEWKRARFDDTVEAAARAQGLPAEAVLFSFPAVEVIRAVLAKGAPYLTRLALQWIAPTELRELRRDIKVVSVHPDMPVPTKELAERLIVPE